MSLHYRIPDQAIVHEVGYFEPLSDDQALSGFVVSSADGQKRYGYKVDGKHSAAQNHAVVPPQASHKLFTENVKRIIHLIGLNGLLKVVVSRVSKATLPKTRRMEFFNHLCKVYPNAFVYYFEDPILGAWIGASPEILLRRIDQQYFVMSLAGTQKKDENREWTEKERVEHQLVADFILEKIQDFGAENIEISGPYAQVAGPVKHLRTDLSFNMNVALETSLIGALHPTPAVCGMPRDMAMETYSQLEQHQRELYTGYIGLFQKNQSYSYVNLRCAQMIENDIYIYVGAGITHESDPESEWQETENKLKTLLDQL